MVLDAAKGIEEQTRKLFEVCRPRDVPIITFVNKLDREGRDLFNLLGRDRAVAGARRASGLLADRHGAELSRHYGLFADALRLFERGVHDRVTEPIHCSGLDDPKLPRLLPNAALAKLREEVEMAKGLRPPFVGWNSANQLPYFVQRLGNATSHPTSRFSLPTASNPSCLRSVAGP
jgi:peptide chain release factor 3